MRQWNEWLFDGRVCLSAEQPSPGALVRVGWAIRNSTDDGKDNKKKARMIAAGRRDSLRAMFLDVSGGKKLGDAFASEVQRRLNSFQVAGQGDIRRFCDQNRLAAWMLPILGVE
jgi:hypothetical protein